MIISLFDYTGYMGEDWEHSVIFDTQHTEQLVRGSWASAWDLRHYKQDVIALGKAMDCTFLAAFPPCTHLAVSGSLRFGEKYKENPWFQEQAMELVYLSRDIGEALGVPYFIENPVSVISSLWRKPDYTFHPYEFGGYLPIDDKHPEHHPYIFPRDAYPKMTCLWTGGGFVLPRLKPVPINKGFALAQDKLGGKSLKTKNIRSATPRGFARAVYELYGRTP